MTSYLWKRREIKVSEEYVSEKFLCITHLPKEILEFIFLFLDGVSLIRCSEVCVNWHSLRFIKVFHVEPLKMPTNNFSFLSRT